MSYPLFDPEQEFDAKKSTPASSAWLRKKFQDRSDADRTGCTFLDKPIAFATKGCSALHSDGGNKLGLPLSMLTNGRVQAARLVRSMGVGGGNDRLSRRSTDDVPDRYVETQPRQFTLR